MIKGEERSAVKSRFEEDILNGNHTPVWGSYWSEGKWGYKCCHSFLKKSYCTGSAGKEQQVCLDPRLLSVFHAMAAQNGFLLFEVLLSVGRDKTVMLLFNQSILWNIFF